MEAREIKLINLEQSITVELKHRCLLLLGSAKITANTINYL